MAKLNDISQLLSGFIFEKLAEDIDSCKIVIGRYKGDMIFKKELKGHEEHVMNFLSMMLKHKEVKRYVYIHKSDKETLDIERDWYRYCLAVYKFVGLKDYIAYTSDSYSDKQINKTQQESPAIIKEVEEKFDEILLEEERTVKNY